MSVDTSSLFAQVIQDHLELKRKNATLEGDMPLSQYMAEDPFDNHPLFKTEEQARIEDTMSGQESIEDAPSPVAWPTDETFGAQPTEVHPAIEVTDDDAEPAAAAAEAEAEPDAESEEGLWTRSRDFDWGD
jgi:hypothetical protein